MLVPAMPYIRIGIHMLISLQSLRNLSPKNSLSICDTLEDFGQGAVEDFQPFSISWWIFPLLRFRFFLYRLFCLWWFCSGLASNACFQSLVGFRRRKCTQGFGMYLGPMASHRFRKASQYRVLVLLSFC